MAVRCGSYCLWGRAGSTLEREKRTVCVPVRRPGEVGQVTENLVCSSKFGISHEGDVNRRV